MASPITKAGSTLDIKLPESPNLSDPATNSEFQEIHNAIRILAEYLDVLRDSLESQPDQIPSVSLRFRNRFWAKALQRIEVGAICSTFGEGIVNGVGSNGPTVLAIDDGAVTLGSTANRTMFGVEQQDFFVALTAANIDEMVQLGVGPGAVAVTGATCGDIIWAVDARSVYTTRRANESIQYFVQRDLVNNGGIYLQNVIGEWRGGPSPLALVYKWEGYWLPGFPSQSGNDYLYNRAFLYPVGVCILDGYVLFADYKRVEPPRKIKPAGEPD